MAFDPDAYLATKKGFDPEAYLAANKLKASDTKPEADGIWSDFGKETAKAFKSGWQHLTPAPSPPERGDSFTSGFFSGPFERGMGAVTRALGPVEMAASPLTGALHAFGGRGLAGLEGYVGEAALSGLKHLGLTKDQIELPDREKVYEQAQADIDKAMLAAGPVRAGSVPFTTPLGSIGTSVEANIAAAKAAEEAAAVAKAAAKATKQAAKQPSAPTEVEQAQQELAAAGTPVDIPRAFTSNIPMVRSGSVALSKAPVIGAPLETAARAVPAQMSAGIETMAQRHAPAMPENIIGGGIEQSLTGAATREAAAAQATAEAEHAARLQAWEQDNLARQQAIVDRQAQATNAAARGFGDVAPMEMAQDTISDVQSAHRQALARQNQRYAEVNALDARVSTDAFHGLRDRVERALGEAGHTIDDPGTNAARMLREVDQLSGRPGEIPPNVPPRMMQALQREYGPNVPARVFEEVGFPGGTDAVAPNFRLTGRHAPEPGSNAISVQGLEKLSTRLGRMVGDAETASDRAASVAVKKAFENWRNDALGSHLTADSEPGSRAVIDAARAAHSDRMNRFGHNYEQLPEGEPRNAAKALNQIVTGGLGPEGLRDNLIGAKPGNRRVSSPLYEAISNAVPNAGEFRNRLRGAYWNEIGSGSPNTIASRVEGLTPTRMGSHLFNPNEHELMRGYARLSQQTPEQLKEAARLARQNEPKMAKVEPGKAERLAKQAIGRSEEKTLGKFDAAIREGGDIKLAARMWGRMTDANRNEVRSNWLRGLGGGGKEFSAAEFVTNWDKYSKQAKTFLLPDRDHRRTVNNFYILAKEFGATLSRYGNPSGTAQVSAWHKLMTGGLKTAAATVAGTLSVFHPIGMAMAGLGGYGVARVLAKPQSARQLTRWVGMAKAYNSAPSTTKAIAFQNATRQLAQSAEREK